MKTTDLIDGAKKKLGLTSDYALAQELGVGKSRIGHYRTGVRKPDVEMCFKLAEILNMDAAAVITAVKLEGSSTPEEKTFWARYAKKYGVAVSLSFILAGTITLGAYSKPAMAAGQSIKHNFTTVCIMRSWLLRLFFVGKGVRMLPFGKADYTSGI